MLIREVTANNPWSPQQHGVATLKTQLEQARVAAKRARIHQQQQRLNQQRVALDKPTAQKKTPAL